MAIEDFPLDYYFIEEGIFKAKYKPGIIIDQEVAEKVLYLREEACNYKKCPTFWDCTGVKYWTKAARDFQSSQRNYELMSAGAVIYTESVLATIAINFFLKFNPPPVPAKFFTKEKDAFEWLRQYV